MFECFYFDKKISIEYCMESHFELSVPQYIKMNFKKLLNFIFTLSCVFGLIYQTMILLTDYFSGNTVVTLDVKRLVFETLPAFTICSSNFWSIKKLTELRPDLAWIYHEYLDYQDKIKNKKYSNQTELDQMKKKVNWLYKHINEKVNYEGLTGYQILSNVTNELVHPYAWFDIGLFGVIEIVTHNKSANKLRQIKTFNEQDKNILKDSQKYPVESVNIQWYDKQSFIVKCWTSFSHLQKKWRDFQMSFELIEVYLYPGSKWLPRGKFYELFFAIHSPNTLPDLTEQNYKRLSTGKINNFHYSQINTKLLGEGYDTNCYRYDLDYKYANFNMR